MPGNLSRRLPIDIDRIMERIREEVRDQEQGRTDTRLHDTPLQARPIRCRDLLRSEDEAFLQQAYQSLLHRMPEPEGLEFWLHKLRRLGWSKVDILWNIRSSREGRVHGVPIRGLKPRYVLYRIWKATLSIPVLGWILRWFWSLIRLPRLATTVARLERGRRSEATEQAKLTSLQDRVTSLCRRADELEKRVASHDSRRHRDCTHQSPPKPPAQK
jgi:O-antigen chain-terminating methyltransferase